MICECGCGKEFTPSRTALWKHKTGRTTRFVIHGHNGRGENNGNWAGGKTFSAQGYILIANPEHENSRKSGYVLEHRYIISQRIGRPLKDTEIVHHINGDKLDNRPENLEITSRSHHALHHMQSKPNINTRRVERVIVNCLNCGLEFLAKPGTPARPRRKYCSKTCQNTHMRGKYGGNSHARET